MTETVNDDNGTGHDNASNNKDGAGNDGTDINDDGAANSGTDDGGGTNDGAGNPKSRSQNRIICRLTG